MEFEFIIANLTCT